MVANVTTYSTLVLLLSTASCASSDAWIAMEWTTANVVQERHHKLVVLNNPEVVDDYCVVRGYFDRPEFTFVAAAKSSSGEDSTKVCEKQQFPGGYFYVDKMIDLSDAFQAISSVESELSTLSEKNLSDDAVWVTSRGHLRHLDYLSLNRKPWSFMYCERGDLISNSQCRVL